MKQRDRRDPQRRRLHSRLRGVERRAARHDSDHAQVRPGKRESHYRAAPHLAAPVCGSIRRRPIFRASWAAWASSSFRPQRASCRASALSAKASAAKSWRTCGRPACYVANRQASDHRPDRRQRRHRRLRSCTSKALRASSQQRVLPARRRVTLDDGAVRVERMGEDEGASLGARADAHADRQHGRRRHEGLSQESRDSRRRLPRRPRPASG